MTTAMTRGRGGASLRPAPGRVTAGRTGNAVPVGS
jgi:hypothetical protein